jgi:hypothetical protein
VEYVFRADGGEVVLDDLEPRLRSFLLLLEHAGRCRDANIPTPCLCSECEGHRADMRAHA